MNRLKIKSALNQALESLLIKLVIHTLRVSGSFKVLLIEKLVKYGYETFVIPFTNYLIRESILYYDLSRDKIRLKDLKDALKSKDSNKYDRTLDRTFGL